MLKNMGRQNSIKPGILREFIESAIQQVWSDATSRKLRTGLLKHGFGWVNKGQVFAATRIDP